MSGKVYVFYYTGPYTGALLPNDAALLARLSPQRRERFERRAGGSQQALDLAALRVLELAMCQAGFDRFRLADIEYPSENGVSGKPVWRNGDATFSISHAQGIAACAVAAACRVGLDAEPMRDIDPRTVRRLLQPDAALAVDLNAGNAVQRWTQIEAVLKGAGLGIMHGRDIDWRTDAVRLHDEQWWLHGVECGARHVMHVAVDRRDVELDVRCVTDLV